METSAKGDYNVEEAFLTTASLIYDNVQRGMFDIESGVFGVKRGTQAAINSTRSKLQVHAQHRFINGDMHKYLCRDGKLAPQRGRDLFEPVLPEIKGLMGDANI